MRFRRYLIVALSIGFVSCKTGTDSNGTLSPTVIMPLTIGNTWIYTDSAYAPSGVGNLLSIDTITLADTATYLGEKFYGKTSGGAWFVNRSSGLWWMLDQNIAFLVKYPGASGEIFKSDTLIITKESSPDPIGEAIANWTITLTDESVNVPAGKFTCYKYNADYYDVKTHQLFIRQNLYYAPNVGRIKSETFALDTISQNVKLQGTSQLTKVTLY